ncbi:MAG: cadherin-like beta sandwich domain-containing protein [Myxococcota bacterium]
MKRLSVLWLTVLAGGCATVTPSDPGTGGTGGTGGMTGTGGTAATGGMGGEPSINSARLESLVVKVGSRVMVVFDPDTLEYDLDVGQLARRLDVEVVPEDPDATVDVAWRGLGVSLVDQLDVSAGVGTLQVDVTSSEGDENRTYAVSVTRRDALVETDSVEGDFGDSVAANQDTMVSGRWGLPNGGVARVFRRGSGGWADEATLEADDTAPGIRFGEEVEIDGDSVFVGAPSAPVSEDIGTGAVYVFDRTGSTWRQVDKIQAPEASVPRFGDQIAASGDTLVVGASGAESSLGAAYVFVRTDDDWVFEQELGPTNGGDASDFFGAAVAIDGDTILIGAPGEDTGQSGSGAVYSFERTGSVWTGAIVKPDTPISSESFGSAVAIDGDQFVAGALGASDGGIDSRGAAYFFSRAGGDWSQERRVVASSPMELDYLGEAVDIQGDVAAVTATSTDFGNARTLIFVRAGTNFWREDYSLRPEDVTDELFFEMLDAVIEGDTLFLPWRTEGVAIVE